MGFGQMQRKAFNALFNYRTPDTCEDCIYHEYTGFGKTMICKEMVKRGMNREKYDPVVYWHDICDLFKKE